MDGNTGSSVLLDTHRALDSNLVWSKLFGSVVVGVRFVVGYSMVATYPNVVRCAIASHRGMQSVLLLRLFSESVMAMLYALFACSLFLRIIFGIYFYSISRSPIHCNMLGRLVALHAHAVTLSLPVSVCTTAHVCGTMFGLLVYVVQYLITCAYLIVM